MIAFTKENGPALADTRTKITKKRKDDEKEAAIYVQKQDVAFTVETDGGIVPGRPGDYLAYDPTSGRVWPMSWQYLEHYYEEA